MGRLKRANLTAIVNVANHYKKDVSDAMHEEFNDVVVECFNLDKWGLD